MRREKGLHLRMIAGLYRLLAESATRDALVQRAWSVGAGPITALIIVRYISPVDQGYYFTFLSLGSLIMFFELGFGQIVVQWIAHASPSSMTDVKEQGALLCGEGALILAIARTWYRAAGLFFSIGAAIVGLWWFRGQMVDDTSCRVAWVLYASGLGLNLAISWQPSVAEGLGKLELVYRIRLWASFAGTVALWAALLSGGRYYGLVLQQLAQAAVMWFGISGLRRRLPTSGIPFADVYSYWRRKLMPLQWRSAVGVVSSFFLFQTTTLVAFRILGPEEAGKIGLVMTIFTMLASLVLLIVSVNAVKLGRLAAAHKWPEFKRLFRQYFVYGLVLGAIGAVGADVLLTVAGKFHVINQSRVIDQPWLWCMFGAAITAAGAQCLMIRMRCLKTEPFALQNLVPAVIWPFLGAVAATYHGTAGLAVAYLLLIILGLAVPVYIKFRRLTAGVDLAVAR